jgi:V/A-type H+/Na+-transporting ATPase subunit D
MELLRLKKRATLAEKGHKLLKEKRDGLMQEFMKIVRQARSLRREVDQELTAALRHFILAQAGMDPQAVRVVQHVQTQRPELTVSEKNVMGVKIPKFEITLKETKDRYGLWETSAELDAGLEAFKTVLPRLLELAAIEKTAQLLAEEIEKTRRRVNALEHVLIPQLKETIRYIRMKLDEQERAAIITSMAVKSKIE